jgi:transmembrane sensor
MDSLDHQNLNFSSTEKTARITGLILKDLADEINTSERAELDNWAAESEGNRRLVDDMRKSDVLQENLSIMYGIDMPDATTVFKRIMKEQAETEVFKPRRLKRSVFYIAASILLVCSTLVFNFLGINSTDHSRTRQTEQFVLPNDIPPKGYRAKLTLADGTEIMLDSNKNGLVARQGNMEIINTNGVLIYHTKKIDTENSAFGYNELATAQGEVLPIILADGTEVWLNSQSSVRYPVQFSGKEREIAIRGEAYFEVAKDVSRPFKVYFGSLSDHKNNMIEVPGTHFNLKAYKADDTLEATLVEGRITITTATGQKTDLDPGKQARIFKVDSGQEYIEVQDSADINEILAWKIDKFQFNGAPLKSVMNTIGRWYDVEVVFEENVTCKLVGEIKRNEPLSKLLEMLETTCNVHFKLEGRKIFVCR